MGLHLLFPSPAPLLPPASHLQEQSQSCYSPLNKTIRPPCSSIAPHQLSGHSFNEQTRKSCRSGPCLQPYFPPLLPSRPDSSPTEPPMHLCICHTWNALFCQDGPSPALVPPSVAPSLLMNALLSYHPNLSLADLSTCRNQNLMGGDKALPELGRHRGKDLKAPFEPQDP